MYAIRSYYAEQRAGTVGLIAGTRVAAPIEDCFNTSSDFSRIKLHEVVAGNPNPTPMFAFVTDLSVSLSNNASPLKAVGVLGAFDVAVGTFAVSGKLTAYFANVAGLQAIRNNLDVTLDMRNNFV